MLATVALLSGTGSFVEDTRPGVDREFAKSATAALVFALGVAAVCDGWGMWDGPGVTAEPDDGCAVGA